jgi:hypothetical protein
MCAFLSFPLTLYSSVRSLIVIIYIGNLLFAYLILMRVFVDRVIQEGGLYIYIPSSETLYY